MPFKYSEQLREELKAYIAERCGLDISDEQADQYLDSLASFFSGSSP